jgi:hypothetical protein
MERRSCTKLPFAALDFDAHPALNANKAPLAIANAIHGDKTVETHAH